MRTIRNMTLRIGLEELTNLKGLLNVINKCDNRVELCSDDLRLNLKSNLIDYMLLTNMYNSGIINDMELKVYSDDDAKRIMKFLVKGEKLKKGDK